MKKPVLRKLDETSWLAQSLKDRMEIEFDKNGNSSRWICLQTTLDVVRLADSDSNDAHYEDGKKSIVVNNISSYDLECRLLGLAAKCTDSDGNMLVHVLVTHDLNSATINSVSDLMFSLSEI